MSAASSVSDWARGRPEAAGSPPGFRGSATIAYSGVVSTTNRRSRSRRSRPRLDIPDQRDAEQLFAVVEVAQSLFRRGIASPEGKTARDHLREHRALPDWLIAEDGFGYVGRGSDTVARYLGEQGADLEAAAEVGLVYRSIHSATRAFERSVGREPESSEELTEFFLEHCAGDPAYYYDYPRAVLADGSRASGDWLTIPIRIADDTGTPRIAGFQYRSMRDRSELAKQGAYMSPLNSPLLSWSELLVGAAEERGAMERSGQVVIVEGKFDQAAVRAAVRELPEDQRPGVIALAGASIRGRSQSDDPAERAGVLAQVAVPNATFFLDADDTGADAVLRAGPLLSAMGTHVSVARVADGTDSPGIKDPGELFSTGGADAVLGALKEGRSRGLATFALEELDSEMTDSPLSGQVWHRLQHLDRLQPILTALPDQVRDRAVRHVADATTIPYSALRAALDTGPDEPRKVNAAGRTR